MHELGLFVTKLEGVYNVDDLNNVESIDNFFDVMSNHHHFLNSSLLFDLAEHSSNLLKFWKI